MLPTNRNRVSYLPYICCGRFEERTDVLKRLARKRMFRIGLMYRLIDILYHGVGHQTSVREKPRGSGLVQKTIRVGFGRVEHTKRSRSRTAGVPGVASVVRVSETDELRRPERHCRTRDITENIAVVQVRLYYHYEHRMVTVLLGKMGGFIFHPCLPRGFYIELHP